MAKSESKSYEPASVERKIFERWQQDGVFRGKPDERTDHFCMVIPPPNVTGALHLGHALNNTLQDILIRRERMAGKNTLWVVGTDHAGIATQATVEKTIRKQEGKSRHDLGREELVRRIWEWKERFGGRIVEQLKLMGCSCDYDRQRFTLDEGCAKAVRHTFFKLFRDGLIYRGKRLVNWDTQLQTAVADDEVYHETVKGHFYHFKYPIIDPQPGEPEFVHIATTRPETMLGDTAVAVHPDPASALDKVEKELKAKLAEASEKDRSQVEAALEDLAERKRTLLLTLLKLRDMAKAGRKIRLPLVEREIPLICDHWAKPELGSGCVKITPAHDPNDYEVGQRHDLPKVNVLTEGGKVAEIVEPDGSVNPNSAKYAGLKFATVGREKVVEDMQAAGLVEQIEDRLIELGHSDRSKAPIEPFLSDQWFVKMGDLTSEPRTSVRADQHTADDPHDASEPRTSVRAEPTPHRMPDLSQGAVLVTWTAYGTWLPGDDRGFVSRVPLADGGHTIHNMPGEPYDAGDPQLRNDAVDQMKGEPVLLNNDQARVLLASIVGSAERHGIELLAVAIMADHVHVLCQTERAGPELQKLFKGAGARMLSQRFKRANSPRWFTRRGSNRFIKKGSDLTPAIEYVLRQERPLLVWGWDSDEGEAAAIVAEARGAEQGDESRTSARTEVRGSQGGARFVTLADGSRAPGLAQAAIDAVKSGKVRFHPPRYEKTYIDWLSEKRDWCISRQLWWGHRIPVWSKPIFPLGKGNQSFDSREWADLRLKTQNDLPLSPEQEGAVDVQVWPNPEQQAVLAFVSVLPGYQEIEQKLENEGFTQDPDVLDTWFSSALWPHSTLGWPDDQPSIRAATVRERSVLDGWGAEAVGDAKSARAKARGSSLQARGSSIHAQDTNEPRTSVRAEPETAAAHRTVAAPETPEPNLLAYYYPTNVLSTAREIITLWVARMVMTGLYNIGEVPFRDVVIHPVIQDGQGRKMSKSLGNGVDPVDIIDKYGADALRFTLADLATETQDIRMSVQSETLPDGRKINVSPKFEKGRNFCNKLWQASTGFVMRNLDGYQPAALDPSSLSLEDRWILSRMTGCLQTVDAALTRYRYSEAINALYHFMWNDYCSAYIEMTKPRLIAPTGQTPVPHEPTNEKQPRSAERGSAQQVLVHVLDQLLRMLHPFIPFVTEAIWTELNEAAPHRGLGTVTTGEPALITAAWPQADTALRDEAVESEMECLQSIIRAAREIRTLINDHRGQAGEKSLRTLPQVVVRSDEGTCRLVERYRDFVVPLAGCDSLDVGADVAKPQGALSRVIGSTQVFVPAADLIDLSRLKETEEKKLAELQAGLMRAEKQLANENFVKRAKPAVVEETKQRAADLSSRIEALGRHLADLG